MEKTQAILIDRMPYRETSLIVQWCAPGAGVFRTIAKGALRPNELLRCFVRYKHVDYYDPALFNRAYDWMRARGMTEGQSQHGALVVG